MNLYLLTRPDGEYDTFGGAVVCAESEAEARGIHPGECWGKEMTDPKLWIPPDKVIVKLIGLAAPSITRGVVWASFDGI
jgi:hypothetical protein